MAAGDDGGWEESSQARRFEQAWAEVQVAPGSGRCTEVLLARVPLPCRWAAATVCVAVVAFLSVQPEDCQSVPACASEQGAAWEVFSRYAIVALTTASLMELVSLTLTYRRSHPLREMLQGMENTFLPPALLCLGFVAIIAENAIIGSQQFLHVAADGAGGAGAVARPVYTPIYLEWLVNVPILFVLAGHCAMGRPLTEISRPLLVTNMYMILAWCAYFVTSEPGRWAMVFVAFVLYAWASVDTVGMVIRFRSTSKNDLPASNLRSALALGLIIVFGVYGAFYLAAMLGAVSSHDELVGYLIMNIGVKVFFLFSFVTIRSRQFYDVLVNVLVDESVTHFERKVAVDEDSDAAPACSLHVIA